MPATRRLRRSALLAGALLSACMPMPMPQGSIETLYPQEPRPAAFDVQLQGRRITGARMDRPGEPAILFLHGSPGEWQNWARYLDDPQLQDYGPLIAPDRPGFGGSEPGRVVPSLAAQAALLAGLLESLPRPAIVVGHSLGGPIAARLAMDRPELVRGLLLIAPSVAPDLEAPRWYNELASWRLLQWMIPDAMLWSNRELYGLPAQLRALEPGWSRLERPVIAVQGLKDRLVYPETADYLAARLQHPLSRVERMPDAGHFVLWEQQRHIVALLRGLITATGDFPPGKSGK